MQPKLLTLLKGFVSAGLLILIFSRFSLQEMWRVVSTAQLPYLLGAVGIAFIIFFSKTLKWLILSRQVEAAVSLSDAALSLLAGMGVGLVTPSRVGEITRVSYLPTTNRSRLVGLVAVDRLLDLTVIVLSGGLALGIVLDERLALPLLIPTTAVLLLLFIPQLPGNILRQLAHISFMPAKPFLLNVASGLSTLNGRVLTLILLLATITFGLGTYQFYWLLRGFDIHSLTAAIVTFPVITVAGVIPITIGGLGTREGATVLILSMFNVPETVAVNAALLSFILNTLTPGVLGLLISPTIKSNIQTDPPQPQKKT